MFSAVINNKTCSVRHTKSTFNEKYSKQREAQQKKKKQQNWFVILLQ